MGRKTEVPITKEVLRWALEESGLPAVLVCDAADASEEELNAWLAGKARPSLSQLRAVAAKLHRQLATFLLPSPPVTSRPLVEFRHPVGQESRALNPTERRYLRRARRLQEAHAWLAAELNRERPSLPTVPLASEANAAAARLRTLLSTQLSEQVKWKSASQAFDAWRLAVERLGITVVLFPMTPESSRGFSLWDKAAPLVAVNTAWRDEARIFTLFHEVGHLLTRTNSACANAPLATGDSLDPAERWCESFSASVLVPDAAISRVSAVSNLKELSILARHYHVSLRAMAISLIGVGRATWTLYKSIPATTDAKPKGGGGSGRNRREIREDELGHRGTEIFVEAVQREVITRSQALDYLDIPVAEFDRLPLAAPTEA